MSGSTLRAFAEVRLGRQRSPQSAEGPHMVRYLRAANVKAGRLDLSDVKEMNFTPSEQVIFELRDGDVLVTEGAGSLAAVGASATWNGELSGPVCFQNTLVRLRSRRGLTDARFLAWWSQWAHSEGVFAVVAGGVNIFHLGAERVSGLGAAFPMLDEQRRIADHLDAETARIDVLITKRQRQIVLLEERNEVMIRACIAESGPAVALRRRWRVLDCKHRTPQYVDSGYPVVSPGDVAPGVLDLDVCSRFVSEVDFLDLTAGRRPGKGDVIYSRNASIGIASYVSTNQAFTMGQDVCLITSDRENQRFLAYALNSLGRDQLDEQKVGSTFSRVNVAQIEMLTIPAPVPIDQDRIVGQLDHQGQRTSRLTLTLRRQIALLRERRQALIAEAVTGELTIA